MKRWMAFVLALAVVILPCLPVGAVDEVKEDFESYQTVDKLKGAGWAFSPDVAGGKISLETVESMDGGQTKAVRVAAKLDAGVSGNPDVYIQKDGVNVTGETVTAFHIKMNETWSFRKIIWREGTSSGTSFLEPFALGSQKINVFGKEVKDKNGTDPLKLQKDIWYDIVIVSTQTVGSNEIPYRFYMNGYCYADDTYTASNLPRKYVTSVRYTNQLNRADVRDISTDYDDIYVGKRTNWSFDNMTMTPANGNMAAPAEGGIIQVDFGTRMDTETIKKENVVLSKYFEGETTVLEDFIFQSNPYGFTIQLPDGTFEKEAKYTLQLSELYDFAGNLIPGDCGELFFETAGEPYIPEFQTDSLVETDFTGFKGTALSTDMTVNSNAGTITGIKWDEQHGDSAAMTLTGPNTTSGPWLGLNVPAAKIPKSGTVVMQCDIRMAQKDATLQLFTVKDSAGKWNTDLNFFSDGSISLVNGNTVAKKLMDYDTATWYTIREEINLDTKKICVYVDGNPLVEDFPLQNGALADVPSARITLVVPGSKEATAYVDNFSIGTKQEVPGVMKKKFLDSAGILRGGQAPQDTTAIQLFFSMPMDASTIIAENFKLMRSADELPVSCSVDYDRDTNIVSVRPSQPLVMNMDYKLEIAKEIRSASAITLKEKQVWRFESAAGDFGRVHLAVLNEADEEISAIANLSAGAGVRGQAELKNMTGAAQEAIVVFAWYQGDILKTAKMMPVTLDAYSSETFTTEAITMENVKDSVLRVFVWSGESGRQAVCEPLTVQ